MSQCVFGFTNFVFLLSGNVVVFRALRVHQYYMNEHVAHVLTGAGAEG